MGFFSKMYYGDPSKGDLKRSDVNKEGRIKLFFTTLGVRFWKLIQLNLLYCLFLIPAFFVIFINFVPVLEKIADSNVAINEVTSLFMSHSMMASIMLIPCLIIAGPATAGTVYVIRNWARDEHAWLWSDFKEKAIENWKQSILIMLINGLAILLFVVNLNFYTMQQSTILFTLMKSFIVIIAFIYGAMNMVMFSLMVTYDLKIKYIIKNAFIMTMAELPRAAIFFILCAAWITIAMFYSLNLIVPVFVVGFALPMFLAGSFANFTMDKYMQASPQVKEDE